MFLGKSDHIHGSENNLYTRTVDTLNIPIYLFTLFTIDYQRSFKILFLTSLLKKSAMMLDHNVSNNKIMGFNLILTQLKGIYLSKALT